MVCCSSIPFCVCRMLAGRPTAPGCILYPWLPFVTKPALRSERGAARKPTSSYLQIKLHDAGDLGLIHGNPSLLWVDWCVMDAL